MKLPKWLYEAMPLVYFGLGSLMHTIPYGTFSAWMFITIAIFIHSIRYQVRNRCAS